MRDQSTVPNYSDFFLIDSDARNYRCRLHKLASRLLLNDEGLSPGFDSTTNFFDLSKTPSH
jgi:hypothetical protein